MPICSKKLSQLTSADFASYRDDRLKKITAKSFRQAFTDAQQACQRDGHDAHWDIFVRHYVDGRPYAELSNRYRLVSRATSECSLTSSARTSATGTTRSDSIYEGQDDGDDEGDGEDEFLVAGGGFLAAKGSPFETKDVLRNRGYRWNPGDNGKWKAWYVDVPREDLEL